MVGLASPSNPPIFVATTGAGTPLPNQTVLVSTSGRCQLVDVTGALVTRINYVSDVNGEVIPNVRLPTGTVGAGCAIHASGNAFTTARDSALLAVYPVNSTHIWTGVATTDWATAANWIGPGNAAVSAAPGSLDQVFVPNYVTIFRPPVLSGVVAVSRLALDTLAVVDINQKLLTIGSLGVTGLGRMINGRINLLTTASLAGFFDKLEIGQTGLCGGMMGTLTQVVAITLDVFCAARIDTSVVAVRTDIVVHSNGGGFSLTQPGAGIIVSGNAQFMGDSLYSTGGNIVVNGNATFGGTTVNVTGGLFNLTNNAFFTSAAATYTNARLSIGGSAEFGGGITGVQLFAGGTLSVSGSFDQMPGASPATFTTSSDHVTQFTGAFTQSISSINTQSFFSVLKLQNTSVGGVVVLDSARTVNGTAQPRVQLLSGKLTLNPGARFFASGGVVLGSGTNLDLLASSNFQITNGNCTGRTTNSATITGPGTFNGSPYTALTCTP